MGEFVNKEQREKYGGKAQLGTSGFREGSNWAFSFPLFIFSYGTWRASWSCGSPWVPRNWIETCAWPQVGARVHFHKGGVCGLQQTLKNGCSSTNVWEPTFQLKQGLWWVSSFNRKRKSFRKYFISFLISPLNGSKFEIYKVFVQKFPSLFCHT